MSLLVIIAGMFLLAKTQKENLSNLFKYVSKEEFDEVKDDRVFTPLLTQHHRTYNDERGVVCFYRDGIYWERNDSWFASQFERKFNTYNEWADYMRLLKPDYLRFAPGGSYILTPQEIHRYPRHFYAKMRDTLSHAVLPAEAHYCERSYYTLWS